MISPEIQYSLEQLQSRFKTYGKLAHKTEEQVLMKQSAELAWNVYQGMRSIKPQKGSIRAERLAALKAGKGIHVRPAVAAAIAWKYNATASLATHQTWIKSGRSMRHELESADGDFHMNLQALVVEREIAIRESGRGFAALSAPRPPASWKTARDVQEGVQKFEKDSRYGFLLSTFTMATTAEKVYAELRWMGSQTGSYQSAVEGLSKAKQQKILRDAITEADINIQAYISRKQGEDIAKAGLN